MAYELTRASLRRIDTASAFSATGAQTIRFRYNLRSIPTGGSFPNRFRLVASSSNTNVFCPYVVLSQTSIAHGFYNGSYFEQSSAITNTTGVWVDLAQVWDFSSTTASLKLYINGSQLGATYTVARGTVSTQALTSLGGDGTAENADAHYADFGFWNTELTAAEITSLNRGFPPRRIRPQLLFRDIPLIRNLQDTARGTTVTAVNSPTVSTHPRSYP